MESKYLDQLAALAHPQRLALFRLLVRRYPDELSAGEIAETLGTRLSTLSTYLNSLRQAGLILQAREGRSLLYRVDMGRSGALMSYLFEDCCRGRPELCPTPFAERRDEARLSRPFNVLFVCTGNSARSIFGEALLRDIGGGRFRAYSAGTAPSSSLNPFALRVLEANGHETSTLRAKDVTEFREGTAPRMDFVFTVCDRAANEDCPAWPGQPVTAHWGLPDPVKATGTEAEKRLAFHGAYSALRQRIELFTALNIDTLDRMALQAAVDDLAVRKDPA
ncbi:metalloregulator ArsR/SmtB family transcription factor [Histidinibacterium aquaticum]|uniref:Metalloregulator ArsR/SmtB family transcription factor n=1 Tax=Histidinibacterium aquaticum TaxID=2613962 RepID=A0A5J5GD50_9RHOB|nr:metalloregulator ArsR/SmtB family transcription factor [Histidinibacterium aquaticum]KAA9006105.1 metalloregulator ArsR/SmtB family transcription factor [Histidinibacterium aquaticum]